MSQLLGNIHGLKKNEIRQLDKIGQRSVAPDQFISPSLAEELSSISLEIRQPLTILFDRQGRVYQVYVGSVTMMGEENRVKFPQKSVGLSGIRAVSTQFDDVLPPTKEALTTLLQYHLDALVLITATTRPTWSLQFGEHPKAADAVFISGLCTGKDAKFDVKTDGPMTIHQLDQMSFEDYQALIEDDLAFLFRKGAQVTQKEKAFLLGLAAPGQLGRSQAEDLLDELSLLAQTAGATIVGRAIQSRSQPDPQFYIGKGKAQELAFEIQQQEANLVIADDELSPAQQRALEKTLRTRVIDRTELILDIFAQRAQSWEGKIQVELAQLQYLLPRLAGQGHQLSQQTAAARGGTIATRGPGETKLELDRRRLRTRIQELERQAESVRQHRQLQRKERLENGMPIIALVGYTNAGKSTLLNTLTQAGALVENKLFATLDPLTRRLVRPGMPPCLLIDTVGFIQKLPTTLIKAFRSTLEEIQSATLILHVTDLSHPDRRVHLEAVQSTLVDLDCGGTPQWLLLNKVDKVKNPEVEIETLSDLIQDSPGFQISAKNGDGIPEFLEALQGFIVADALDVCNESLGS